MNEAIEAGKANAEQSDTDKNAPVSTEDETQDYKVQVEDLVPPPPLGETTVTFNGDGMTEPDWAAEYSDAVSATNIKIPPNDEE